MIVPIWFVPFVVSCSAPDPAASTGAFAPHAGTDVVGVVDPPAVRHASPKTDHRLGVEAAPVNESDSTADGVAAAAAERMRGAAVLADAKAMKTAANENREPTKSARNRTMRTTVLILSSKTVHIYGPCP